MPGARSPPRCIVSALYEVEGKDKAAALVLDQCIESQVCGPHPGAWPYPQLTWGTGCIDSALWSQVHLKDEGGRRFEPDETQNSRIGHTKLPSHPVMGSSHFVIGANADSILSGRTRLEDELSSTQKAVSLD